MKSYKKYFGKMVRVAFLDHAIGTKDAVMCTAMGQVVKVNKHSIVLRYWHCADDEMDNDTNNEFMSIITSAIKEIKVLR